MRGTDNATTILVCEDDREIRRLLAEFLRGEGYAVLVASDGEELGAMIATRSIDLVILDWMLPGEDGLSICRRLREVGGPPVLMLTARDADGDRVVGIDSGADAYISKPFNAHVLLAQVRAILRTRAGLARQCASLRVGDVVIYVRERRVAFGRIDVELTSGEFDLLLCFVRSAQRVLSRDRLMEMTRGHAVGALGRSIDVQISRLRQKLNAAGSEIGERIRAVRNAGYILSIAAEPEED